MNSLPKRQWIFIALYNLSVICATGVLSFSVSTWFDKIVFGAMLASFAVVLVSDLRQDGRSVRAGMRERFRSARFLYIAVGAYFLWDAVTLLYTRDLELALKKYPYCAEYLLLLLAGIYYCANRGRLRLLLVSFASVGTMVSIGSYLLYFFSRRPYYFQRLSTARDYNVYSTLIFMSLVVAVVLILNYTKLCFWKRTLLLAAVLAVNLPAYYLAGSRRMFIMIPWFFAFIAGYELLRLLFAKPRGWGRLGQQVVLLAVCAVFYLGAMSLSGPFSRLGASKEIAYQKWEAEQLNPDTGDGNGGGGSSSGSTAEKTISTILDTIEDGSMSSKRKLIYSVALRELLDYSTTEWIFGRGAAYDLYLYDHTDDAALLEAYSINENNPRAKGWMSAHNFTLADALNGGLVKLVLGLVMVGTIIAHIVLALRRERQAGVLLAVPFALIFVNNFISGAYGMFNDVFFAVMMTVLFGMLYLQRSEAAKSAGKELGDS